MAEEEAKSIPVRVALRIRPFVQKEIDEGCAPCLDAVPRCPQVCVKGSGEPFTYDYVFDGKSRQESIYTTAVSSLIEQIFKGYNVTILAYGQTGSGKTFTMGTADFSYSNVQEGSGIIPRAIQDIFAGISSRSEVEFLVKVSFLELYKEQLFDLLSSKSRGDCIIDIREDAKGIKLPGLSEVLVNTPAEAMKCLETGSQGRQIGATAMNDQSSRSHAVFTLTVEQRKDNVLVMSSRFHLVDLAGSERVAKTKATGDRFREGVKINAGLLALGNVICKLGAGDHKHINYRDSKLTRLLQDSLGGNSYTLMIACVGPADYNMDETVSTLRYADRARKIKNKPIKNQDPHQMEIEALKKQVKTLEYQLEQSGGVTATFVNTAEISQLREKLRLAEENNQSLSQALQSALEQNTANEEKVLLLESTNSKLKERVAELENMANATFEVMNKTVDVTRDENQSLFKHMVEVQAHISLIQREQDNCDEEMLTLELNQSRVSIAITSSAGQQSSVQVRELDHRSENIPDTVKEEEECSDDESDEGREEEYKQEVNRNVLDRAKMSRDLNTLHQDILAKQDMVRQLTKIVTVPTDVVVVKNLEDQVSKLQKEREELMQQLQSAQSSTASTKVSEQRRKRVEDLEHQIGDLKKKIVEQTKALNQKKKIEFELTKLNSEIQNLKSIRVKMIRQMREDGEKFRQWKKVKDHEIIQLKEHERRREGERIRKDRLHSKQQLVMKRRLEDAINVSKRLKEAMERIKTASTRLDRNQASKATPTARAEEQAERIRSAVDREVHLLCSLKQAQRSSKVLADERKGLVREIASLKTQVRSAKSNEASALRARLKIAESDLEIRSGQILELQKLAAIDMDSKGKSRWDNLTTMQDAKIAMNSLFEGLVETKVESASRESELNDLRAEIAELQVQYDKAIGSLESHNHEMRQQQLKHEDSVHRMKREYEDKVLILMAQMTANDTTTSTVKTEQFHDADALRIKALEADLVEKRNEVEQLRSELDHLKQGASGHKRKGKPNGENVISRYTVDEFFNSSQEEVSDGADDIDDDPEWQKTPMYRRIKAMTNRWRDSDSQEPVPSLELEEADEPQRKAMKRPSIASCRCATGACTGCACVKDGRSCNQRCKCSATGKCGNIYGNSMLNKENHGQNDSAGSASTSVEDIDSTADKQDIDTAPPKKKRAGKT